MNTTKTLFAATWMAMAIVAGCSGSSGSGGTQSTTTAASSGSEHHPATTADSNAPLIQNGQAHVGDRTTCPVSGEQFVVASNSPSVEYEGHTYYFCCANCVSQFRQNPQEYIRRMQQPSSAPPAAGTNATGPRG